MNQSHELKKWNEIFINNKPFKKELKLIESKQIDINKTSFFKDLRVNDNSIFGTYNIGYNCINAITVKKIIDIFENIIPDKKNEYFLMASDGSKECLEIMQTLLNINDKKIRFITFNKFEGYDRKFVVSTIKKLQPYGSFYISKSIYSNNLIEINLYDSNGLKVNNEILEGILRQIEKSVLDIKFSQDNIVSFLNNETLTKIFVDKISSLFTKTSYLKKTKIAISNRSNGITNILTKLIGSQDFSYVVNNNISRKTINIFNKKNFSDDKIKWYFKREIFFAKKNRANFLVVYNPQGTQMFVFSINGSKITYFSSNLTALVFLNYFYNNLELSNLKLNNSFVSSNDNVTKNITCLFHKYNIFFKKIQNNNFISSDYMLLFWNEYNQFVFGEKINDDFSIYSLLIKMIGIIDYYESQYGSIKSLLNRIKKMYGDLETTSIHQTKVKYDTAIQKLDTLLLKGKLSKLFIRNDPIMENGKWNISNDLWRLTHKNETKFLIYYNQITNLLCIKVRRIKTGHVFNDYLINKYEIKNIIRNIKKLK